MVKTHPFIHPPSCLQRLSYSHVPPPAPAPYIHTHPLSPPYDQCGLLVDEAIDATSPRPGKLNAGVNFYNFYKGLSHTGYEQDDTLQLFFVQDDDNAVWVTTNFGMGPTQDWIGTTIKGNNVGGSKTFIVFKDDPEKNGQGQTFTDKGARSSIRL